MEIEKENALHLKRVKDIKNENKGLFLMMVKLEKEEERHQNVLQKYNKKLQNKLEQAPNKVTEFKVNYKRYTNFSPMSIEAEHNINLKK